MTSTGLIATVFWTELVEASKKDPLPLPDKLGPHASEVFRRGVEQLLGGGVEK